MRRNVQQTTVSKLHHTPIPAEYVFIGIALVNTSQSGSVNYTLSGTNCTFDDVFYDGMCQPVMHNLTMSDIVGNLTSASTAVYAKVTVGQYVNSMKFSAPVGNNLSYRVYIGYGTTPVVGMNDVTDQTIVYPSNGNLSVLYVINGTMDTTYTIPKAMITNCTSMTAGPTCQYPLAGVPPTPLLTDVSLLTNQWSYYEVTTQPLWVNVYSANKVGTDFNVYVRAGTLPAEGKYDVMNCNAPGYCAYATVINLNNTLLPEPQTYFVGVQALTNITYTIWWSSTCAPGCENADESGVCNYNPPNIGFCSCEDGYKGFACTTPDGTLPTQYIVLIIIASLVVLSALIGFFAWAYMQRKREGYSSLS